MSEKCLNMVVCIDSYEDALAEGRIYSSMLKKESSFCSLDQMLLALEDVMNQTGCPVRDMPLRQYITNKQRKRKAFGCEYFSENVSESDVDNNQVRVKMGDLISFNIKIYFRRNYSIQGQLSVMDSQHATIAFRSGMELLLLIHNTLSEVL